MARSPFTLAALATSAVATLDVRGARSHSYGLHGDFDSAVIIDADGRELLVRVPTSQPAETEQSADLISLRALTTGIRSRLPFDLPSVQGQAPIGDTRGVVYDYLPGTKFEIGTLPSDTSLARSVGRTIAAIHSLPTGFIMDSGLAAQTTTASRSATIDLIGRASDTGSLPVALLQRWEQATDNDSMWQFAPTVIHGSLSDDSMLVTGESISGVVGWGSLAVGDPARDLHWLLAAAPETVTVILDVYASSRKIASDPQIMQRATLYSELELARWLMHGKDTHDQGVVDDAVAMLDALVDSVLGHIVSPISRDAGPALAVSEVEQMLADTPRDSLPNAAAHLQTDSYDRASFGLGSLDDPRDSDLDDADLVDTDTDTETETETDTETGDEKDDAESSASIDQDATATIDDLDPHYRPISHGSGPWGLDPGSAGESDAHQTHPWTPLASQRSNNSASE